MRIATAILIATALASPLAAEAATQRADVAATFIGGIGEHPISGDGRRVVFDDYEGTPTDGDFDIFLWDRDEGYRRLTDEYPKPGLNFVDALAVDHDGDTVAAIAKGDLADTGATADELYRWTEAAGWERLTFTDRQIPKIFPGAMAISADGDRIVFTSRDDYTGDNPDGELQIFLWDETGGISQITHGFPCGDFGGNFAEDLSGDGRRILFSSRCQYGTSNPDLGMDVFLWDETGGVRALTHSRTEIGISATLDHDGDTAAVVSRFDVTGRGITGTNLYRWIDGSGFERLRKDVSQVTPSIDAAGDRIVYVADNGQGGKLNPEGADEIFFWQEGLADVAAITDSAQTDDGFGNTEPHLSADGTRLSMFALRAFDAPADERTGHYVIDVLSPQARRPNLLDNGGFDAGLTGWRTASSAVFSPDDGKEDPASGSAIQRNDQPNGSGGGVSAIDQCIKVEPKTEYLVSALLRIVPGDRAGRAFVRVNLYPSEDCGGSPETFVTVAESARADGAWTADFGRFTTGPATRTARVVLFAGKDDDGGELEAGFDDLVLRRDNPVEILP